MNLLKYVCKNINKPNLDFSYHDLTCTVNKLDVVKKNAMRNYVQLEMKPKLETRGKKGELKLVLTCYKNYIKLEKLELPQSVQNFLQWIWELDKKCNFTAIK